MFTGRSFMRADHGFVAPLKPQVAKLFVVFAFLTSVHFAAAQSIGDPSIGRNIPGGRPLQMENTSPAAEVQVKPDVSVFEPVQSIGKPGTSPLRSIVFTNNTSGLSEATAPREAGIQTQEVDLLSTKAGQNFLEEIEKQFLNQPFVETSVQEISSKVINWYVRRGYPVVFIKPLIANFETGSLEILVVEAKVGQVRAEGARWFSNERIAKTVRLKPGEAINRRILANDLFWINDNPFLRVDGVLEPGDAPGTTNVVIQVVDRFPIRTYGGLENTGTEQNGEWRWLAGINWGNAFMQGHQLNYQFSAAVEDIDAQAVHATSYVVPLPWRHSAAIYSTLSSTDVDLSSQTGTAGLVYRGLTTQLSPRYTIPLGGLTGPYLQEFVLGLDWKTNDLYYELGGTTIPKEKTTIFQMMAGYNIGLNDSWGRTTLGAEVFWSPGDIEANNTDSAFREVDPRLDSTYLYSLLRLSRYTQLPWNCSLQTQVVGQISSEILPSSEQHAIGGYGTVRGYPERILSGDQAVVINMELRSPSLGILQALEIPAPKFTEGGANRVLNDSLQALVFWDFGLVNSKDPLPGDPWSSYLTSVGVGLRYDVGSLLNVRCDLGFPLHDADLDLKMTPRVSLGVIAAF